MSKFKDGDCISLEGILHEDFIKLHQLLEDSGESMYMSTKNRMAGGLDSYFKYVDNEWMFGGMEGANLMSWYEIHRILGQETEPQYEIY